MLNVYKSNHLKVKILVHKSWQLSCILDINLSYYENKLHLS